MAVSDRVQRRIVLLLAAASLACAPAGREGEAISITGETAIIVWDAANKTQHFIRKADFRTKAKDFGFLVPTPTVPKLDDAANESFGYLAKLTAAQTVWRLMVPKNEPMPKTAAAPVPKSEAVKVIETKKVAGYDAAVLEASNADALGAWLKQHGYHSSPELVEWFKPYIAQKWKITAFKIDKDADGDRAKASAVRMSFGTDRPFFPYREPVASKSEPDYHSRTLRIFFLGSARFEGRVGDSGTWPGETVWSGLLEKSSQQELFRHVRLPEPGQAFHLTEYIDRESPRPGSDDLFFSRSADQSPVRRPDIVYYISPLEAVFILLIVAILIGIALWIARGLWRLIFKQTAEAKPIRQDPTSTPPST